MYQDGKGLVRDEIVPGAKVFILMQNPGDTEEQEGIPACGKTGQLMNSKFLPLAGLTRGVDVSVGNIIKCRWQHTNDMPPDEILEEAAEHCVDYYLNIPEEVELIVVQGKVAFDVLTEGLVFSEWRGHILTSSLSLLQRPLYVVTHLAAIARDYTASWVAELDWRKIPRILRGEHPIKLPERQIIRG